MLGNFERLESGANGYCGYEDDDGFVVPDEVGPELEAEAGGFFVHNAVKALASHPVEFGDQIVAPTSVSGAAAPFNGGSHAAVRAVPLAGAVSSVSPHFASVPPLFEAFTSFATHWDSVCAQRGKKGAPARIPNSLYPFGFDVAYQAKLAHPRHQITADVVDEIKKMVPLEADSIRAFLKRAFKAGVSAKHGLMAAEAAALEAMSLRGSGAILPRSGALAPVIGAPVVPAAAAAAASVVAAAAAAAAAASPPQLVAAPTTASAPSTAAPQPTVGEIKNAATHKKALVARQTAAAELLATFRKMLDSDIATGKIAEPLPAGAGESESKRRAIVWRPQLRDLLGECVEAELAVAELVTLRSQFVDAGTVVPIDDKVRERLRTESRDNVCRKMIDIWPAGMMTMQKCRAAYQVYHKRVHATPAVAEATSGAAAAAVPAVASQAAVAAGAGAPPWKTRKRFICVYSGCSEGFNSLDPLKNHVVNAHHDGDASAVLQLPERPEAIVGDFKCELPGCYETFFAPRDLNMHITKRHPGHSPVAATPATPTTKKRGAPDSARAERATPTRPAKQSRKKVAEPVNKSAQASGNGSVDEGTAVIVDDDDDDNEDIEEVEAEAMFQCALCSKPAQYECTGCSSVHYCSQECQMASWKSHMDACKLLAKKTKEQAAQANQ
jgi:hypothetical protein